MSQRRTPPSCGILEPDPCRVPKIWAICSEIDRRCLFFNFGMLFASYQAPAL